jgi:hypothetical protein
MAEGLGRELKSAVSQHKITGLCLHGDNLLVSHQQFVDDTILMGILTVKEAHAIKQVL